MQHCLFKTCGESARGQRNVRSEEVNMVMDCLSNANRFFATASFTDTGLKNATYNGTYLFFVRFNCRHIHFWKNSAVRKYNPPMNYYLQLACRKYKKPFSLVFDYVNCKLRLSAYPIRRALPS